MLEENKKTKPDYYLGTVVEVVDPVLYQIKCDIPGEFDAVLAFPIRGEVDEPKVGDFVLLRSFDPIYHSYFLYQKLKENDFIGFRSNGKMVDITPDYIQIATFDPSTEYTDGKKGSEYRPEPQDWIKLDSGGNIDMYLRSNATAKIDGDGTVEIKGNVTIKVEGNSKIEVSGDSEITVSGNSKETVSGNVEISSSGSCTIDSPDVKITGASLTVKGSPTSPSVTGPFCSVPNCLFTGAPHRSEISPSN